MDYPLPKKIFIGVSWPYANGDIHLGHLAGQNVSCDVFARYHRLKGHDVLMVSGSDSHGAPVIFKAEELGLTPAQLAQQCHEEIVKTFNRLGFVYENYTKTTTENHKVVVQNIFSVLNELGYLEIKESEQYFDTKVERFLPDRYVRGTCPNCKATNARGDECPECGAFLNPTDLIDPYSTLSDSKPKLKKTKHFYMNLEKLEPDIAKWLRANNKRWRKWVREFTKGWIKQGLEPRAVTRDLSFGIPVPVEGWEDKVIYVWIEAVVGYLSAAIEWASKQEDPSLWETFWKNPDCEHYYFVAGGNVPFHTILWPAEIVAYNKKYKNALEDKYKLPGETNSEKLNLPFDVPANKMLLLKGRKMSKGDGTGITIAKLLEKYNPDLIRYFFIRYSPENHDREFIWKDFIDANNNELVANLGNFINRTLTFLYTKFEGKVPEGTLEDEVKEKINETFTKTSDAIEKAEFVKAMEAILELGHFANKYFNDKQPWVTIKNDRNIAENTIYNTIQLVNAFRILLKPFTPFSMDKLGTFLNVKDEYDPTKEVAEKGRVSRYLDQWEFNKIEAGRVINQPSILFEKLEYSDDLKNADNSGTPESEAKHELVISEEFKKLPILSENIQIKSNKYSKKIEEWITQQEAEILNEAENKRVSKLSDEYVKLHNKYSNQENLESSAAMLRSKIKESGKLLRINPFVDIYNIVSAKTGVSFGAHDITKLKGDVTLKVLPDTETFIPIGEKKPQVIQTGEYAYYDQAGIICRLDIKQCERTKVTAKTKNIFVIAQGNSALKQADVEKAMGLLRETISTLL